MEMQIACATEVTVSRHINQTTASYNPFFSDKLFRAVFSKVVLV